MQKEVTILLVEDDDIDIRAVRRGLASQKINNPLVVAKDGIEAFQILRGTASQEKLPTPFLIILDLNLPRMNGIEFLSELRKDPELRSSIVFVLTTSSNETDKEKAYYHNVAGYILKADPGPDFMNLVRLLEDYVVTIQFPHKEEVSL